MIGENAVFKRVIVVNESFVLFAKLLVKSRKTAPFSRKYADFHSKITGFAVKSYPQALGCSNASE